MKFPLYAYLNFIMTGCVFIIGLCLFNVEASVSYINSLFNESTSFPSSIITIFIILGIYELGLIINRIGSVIIEPLLRTLLVLPFNDDYKKYNDVKQKYSILDTLSREYAISRTGISLFVLLAIVAFLHCYSNYGIIYFAIGVIFILSARKYAIRIVDLMKDE